MVGKVLRIGIDATTWSNDRGFGRFTRELLRALAARDAGFHYTLLIDEPPSEAIPDGVEVIQANAGRTLNEESAGRNRRSLAYFWRIARAARRARFDVFFYPAVYSYFPLLTRIPCVVCYHDTTAERLPDLLFPTKLNFRLWQLKTALARFQTTRAMTISQASAKDLEAILRIKKSRIDLVTEAANDVFRVLNDSAEIARERTLYQIPGDAELLVHLGGMNRHKNIIGLLRAMPEVVARRPQVHLAIVGSTSGSGFWDNVPELKQFIATHPPLSDHVHLTDRISDEAVVKLLNGADALVFPSLWEGFGLPAVEAMSCGLPVLASDRGSLPEVVGDAGLFFDPEDPRAISDCILKYLGDDALRGSLPAQALERSKKFTWHRAAELAETCFRRCYEAGRS